MKKKDEMTAYERLDEEWSRDQKHVCRYSFGVPVWLNVRGNTMIHKKEDAYLVTNWGENVIEVYKNYFVLFGPPQVKYNTYPYTWRRIVNDLISKKGVDIIHYTTRKYDPRLNLHVCTVHTRLGSTRFFEFCAFDWSGKKLVSDMDNSKLVNDAEKIKRFNKNLLQLTKPLEVMVRMGHRWEDVLAASKGADQGSDLIREEAMLQKIYNGEPLELIDYIRYSKRTGYWYRNVLEPKDIVRRLLTTRKNLRLTFFRTHTNVVYERYIPEEAYVRYQSMVLQQADGLRKVPISGETEVHRQSPRASEAPPAREERAC